MTTYSGFDPEKAERGLDVAQGDEDCVQVEHDYELGGRDDGQF